MSLGANLLSIFVPSYFLTVTKLEGKSQEQVKEAFLEFLKIDKTKPGGYASVGSNKVICKVAKEACGVNSVLEIKKAEDATEVSKLLTGRIDEELDYGKRHQMTSLRCHVRKYIEFLNFCEGLKGKPVYEFDKSHSSAPANSRRLFPC